jgi:hypothetical protein
VIGVALPHKGVAIMSKPYKKVPIALVMLLLGLWASLPAYAGSAIVGSVAGASNATLGQQIITPGSTVFSGDSLRTSNGTAIVMVGQGSRLIFGQESAATFARGSNSVSAMLSRGNVSLFHPESDKTDVHLQIGNVMVTPVGGYKTLGEIAMNNSSLVVSTRDGELRVETDGKSVNVPKGQTMTFVPKTARAPQAGGAQKVQTDWPQSLLWAAAAAGGVAAILAGISIKRSNDANDTATAAAAAANSATSEANAAASAASAASSAAAQASSNSIAAGCALNAIENSQGMPSPYTPPSGVTCPTVTLTSPGRN